MVRVPASVAVTVGAVVLFAVESRLPKSAHFTLPKVQIVIGLLAWAVAGYLALTKGRPRTPPVWLIRLLEDKSLWVAGAAGLGIALPSLDYLAALAVIAAGATAVATRLSALLMFNVVAFALIEIPLLAYLVAPQRTHAAMTRLHHAIRARRRNEIAALLGIVGTVLLAVGLLAM